MKIKVKLKWDLPFTFRENHYYKYILQVLDKHIFILHPLIIFLNPGRDSIFLISVGISCNTAQKMKFSIKDFFSKCDQIKFQSLLTRNHLKS